ncbi:Ppx/GppA family phosphatase [Periweissella fabalis]|uniref:Ppx/GppA family phosphatase n=1 Tax=Periweissella fabalis TaxID=1070421 RepID=A0A7X6N2Y9_9LACO|nr:Ppx/GppA family phosphatase [Periweissella fabalis]MCM0599691.1 Ppx/GppA family phosphatase [Periweissella fabalis]NKZ24896.1 Ppx/GppA family phosphatase [Periweissella fabalis]
MGYLAIVDLGSNSTRMVIEKINADGTYTEIQRVKEDTRLSEGMGETLILQDFAVKRVLNALHNFQAIYNQYPDIQIKAIATAAVRQAVNQAEFLKCIKNKIGIDIQVLSGDDEAYYDYLGVEHTLAIKDALLVDTGGASVELVLVRNGQKEALISVPFGAVSLSEKFNLHDAPSAQAIFQANRYVQAIYNQISWLSKAHKLPIVLLGGANRTLARMQQFQVNGVLGQNFHGFEMSATQTLDLFELLLGHDQAGRVKLPGLDSNRADIILGGCLPILNLIMTLATPKIIFSESGVREGIITEYMQRLK